MPIAARRSRSDAWSLEEALIHNGVRALVATSALGMGFDKPDLGFVIHYQSPSSPGRRGRGAARARPSNFPSICSSLHPEAASWRPGILAG
jgi:ATP-dependent DNA helicase RecQ